MNQGGSYIIKKNSQQMTLLERTTDHPEGSRPRVQKTEVRGQKTDKTKSLVLPAHRTKRKIKPEQTTKE